MSTNTDKILLVISLSARAIVSAVRQAGFDVVSIDLFGDDDTVSQSLAHQTVHSFSWLELEHTIRSFQRDFPIDSFVYGSGLEEHLDTLTELESILTNLGNSSSLLIDLLDKHRFFQTLDFYDIPYPETSFIQPVEPGHWLIKTMTSSGGQGIYDDSYPDANLALHYWQKPIDAKSHSVLFCGTQNGIEVIGFNSHLFTRNESRPYIFTGIWNQADVNIEIKNEVTRYLQVLHQHYVFRGPGSLDFLVNDKGIYVLEINARFPASAQIYSTNILDSMLDNYGKMHPSKTNVIDDVKGFFILYCDEEIVIPLHIEWPDYVCDIPPAGTLISRNMPLCSMIIVAKSQEDLLLKRMENERFINHLIHLDHYKDAIPS